MAVHLSRLRALPPLQRAAALRELIQRAPPEELPALQQALAEVSPAPVGQPRADALELPPAPIPPGAVALDGLHAGQVVAALLPFRGQRVALHVGTGEQREVLSAVLHEVAQVGRHARIDVSDYSPWSAASVRQPGETLFIPPPQDPGVASFDLTPRGADRPLLVQPLPLEDTAAMHRASSTDQTVHFHDLALAIHRGAPLLAPDLLRLRAQIASGQRSTAEVLLEVERVLKALTSAATRPLVERTLARPDFRSRVLEGAHPPAGSKDASFGSRLTLMADLAEGLFEGELRSVRRQLRRGVTPEGIHPAVMEALETTLAFKDQIQRRSRPLEVFLSSGFGTGTTSAANLTHVALQRFQQKHGHLPSPQVLRGILQRSRGVIRHDLAGADLEVFMVVIAELGAPHWSEDFFQLVGDPERVDFDPERVREFAAEKGYWLDTKLPRTSGCPARALGSIDLIANEMEDCFLIAYADQLARRGGVEL